MIKLSKIKVLLALSVIMLLSLATVVLSVNQKNIPITASAQELSVPVVGVDTINAAGETDFYIQNGAWVRVSSSGMKFETYVKPSFHESLKQGDNTVTYFATAKVVGGTKEMAMEMPFSQTLNDDGNYTLRTYINFNTVELDTPEKVNAFYAKDFATSTYAKVESADGNTVTYYKAYSGTDGEIVRSMRAVGNEAWLNWTGQSDYTRENVEKYFTLGNRSTDQTAYALTNTDKVIFAMPKYTANAEALSAYVGAEKYTATLNNETGKYEIADCGAVAQNLSIFTDENNTVYSTKMLEAHELNGTTITDLQTATEGYYVLTEDIDMSEKTTWSSSGTFTGTLDGFGFKLYNFTSPSDNYKKLINFSGEGATFKNLDVHMLTNSIRGGLIGQVHGATTVENVNVICDTLNTSVTSGVIANVIQGTLTVKDTNIIVKNVSGNGNGISDSGFIAGHQSSSKNVVVQNVSCFEGTGKISSPFTYGTLGTDGQPAENGEDYFYYSSYGELQAAIASNETSEEFEDLIKNSEVFTVINNITDIEKIKTATSGYYVLTSDIDMDGEAWTASGIFCGIFDGNGYKIKNFTAPNGNEGFFHYVAKNGIAVIKNLNVHIKTNTLRSGFIGQVQGLTFIDNVNFVCDNLNGSYSAGPITNVVQGKLNVTDTNIIIKSFSGSNANRGYIVGGEANSNNLIVSNVVCYNASGTPNTPYAPNTTTYGTLGTDGEAAVESEDYYAYLSLDALITAYKAGQLSTEFIGLLETEGIINLLTEANITKLNTATDGYYVLTKDIDMSDKTWNLSAAATFKGTLDGNGYKIRNLNGNLFYKLDNAKIRNLILEGVVGATKGVLCKDNLAANVEITNVVVTVASQASGTWFALLGYQTSGRATLKNVVIDMFSSNSGTSYRGFITAHAGNDIIMDGVYCIGGTGTLHSTDSGNAGNYVPDYYKANGETAAVKDTDYFIYENVAQFKEADLTGLDQEFKSLIEKVYIITEPTVE